MKFRVFWYKTQIDIFIYGKQLQTMLNIRTNITRKNVIFNCRFLNAIEIQLFSDACEHMLSGHDIVFGIRIT